MGPRSSKVLIENRPWTGSIAPLFYQTKWQPLSSAASKMRAPDSLRFLTYNIWFEDHFFDERMAALCKEVETSNADVICLQEVTDKSLARLLGHPFIQQNYITSDADASTFSDYGVTMLCRKTLPVSNFEIHPFNSFMGRRALLADLRFADAPLRVCTAHFESLNTTQYRIPQFAQCFSLLEHAPTGLLMGDFNFDKTEPFSDPPEQAALDKRYVDLWCATHDLDKEESWTMCARGGWFAWRPDRVLMRSEQWKVHSVTRVGLGDIGAGCKDCEREEHACTPSDHCGLLTVIKRV
eukprot:TRINITY_DN5822_c0_g1_i1.p1 TRINITY_DN5822_c0_g1~~TRINITY_DN5822_c0_g1_i1.p1  ORF type:complete len:295 (-),score=28.95 TRINITY_DN5822_c0_g1_i1:147-1031(-)